MTIKDIANALESIAPLKYQESYDNAGLIIGDMDLVSTGVLFSLDITEEVIEEAVTRGCNMVVAHHPLIFSGVKRVTGANHVERCIIKAIKNDIAIYAIHTNLDNVAHGVNHQICERLSIKNKKILSPKGGSLEKLVVFCPGSHADAVLEAMFAAGGGDIGEYKECSFSTQGTGSFLGKEGTNPFVGEPGIRHKEEEQRLEIVVPSSCSNAVIRAMIEAHPYEAVAYDLYPMLNKNQNIGSGMIGELEDSMGFNEFLTFLKTQMKTDCVRHTQQVSEKISKVAVCGGAGSFLLQAAIAQGADIFITGDYKYHEFFDADKRIVIADIGHYESEQFTPELLIELLTRKFPNFALHLSEINTNPINYF